MTLLVCSTAPAAPRPLSLVLPADPTALRGMRIRLGRWLEELGAAPAEMRDIQLASHEACCNAMEHGYEFGDNTLELAASKADGGVRIVVTDEGRWREPHGPNGTRGRGIDVMRELMGEVDVVRSDEGTRVEMSRLARRDRPRSDLWVSCAIPVWRTSGSPQLSRRARRYETRSGGHRASPRSPATSRRGARCCACRTPRSRS